MVFRTGNATRVSYKRASQIASTKRPFENRTEVVGSERLRGASWDRRDVRGGQAIGMVIVEHATAEVQPATIASRPRPPIVTPPLLSSRLAP